MSDPARRDPATKELIRAIAVEKTKRAVGPFSSSSAKYHAPARTRFQEKARARENEIRDLQHITRVLKADTVARLGSGVCAILRDCRLKCFVG